MVTSCITRNGIKRLDWPAQSPDLNPAVNLQIVLKKTTSKRNPPPKRVADLKTVDYLGRMKKIPKQIVQTLVESMPKRTEKVTKA